MKQCDRIIKVFCFLAALFAPLLAQTVAKDTTKAIPTALASTPSPALIKPIINALDQIPVQDSVKIPILDFKNTDIRDVLRAVGMQYNVNIYLEPDVTGTVSLYLVDVSVKKAIDFIVKRRNFSYIVENNIVKVFKPVESAPPPPPVTFSLKDSLLTIDVKAISPQEAARLFTDSTGINVVIDGPAKKELSGHIVKLKPIQALQVLFETNGYSVSSNNGVYYASANDWNSDPNKAAAEKSLKRLSVTVDKYRKVSVEVDNAQLDQLVRSIAIQSGISIFIYDAISGTITAKCDSINLDDALRFLLQNTKFTFWKDKEIYFIGSREMSQQKTTIVIPLKHIMADENDLSKMIPPNIAQNSVIKYDKEHNAIIVIGSFDIVAQAQEFIEKVDNPIPQVLIEALVVDFNINKIRDYGVSIFTQGIKDTGADWIGEKFLPALDLKPGQLKIARVLNYVLKELGVNRVVNLPNNFRVAIHALESADIVKVHSTPQIATINGNPASITIGETRYYKLRKETAAANTATNNSVIGTDERFETLKFNTQLQVTPWVMDQGYVMCKIRPEFNIPRAGGDASTPPNVDTRVIESMVRLKNGQTIILGGQRQTEDMVKSSGVPLLSSIPILGWLFSSKTITKSETQMMIFLTPHVYYGDDSEVSPDDYFGSNMDWAIDKKYLPKEKKKKIPTEKTKPKVLTDGKSMSDTTATGVQMKTRTPFRWPWQKDKSNSVGSKS